MTQTQTRHTRSILRRLLPFGVRTRLVWLRRVPSWVVERPRMARRRLPSGELASFTFVLASHRSPLCRKSGAADPELQAGKEVNVRRAAELLDGIVVAPGQVFSHHHAVGRTVRRRGFRTGLELHNGAPASGVGGGMCQVSNSFYWVAVRAGMTIVERHRHGLDLFPDDARTVPFGCGATVVYNYADFRFANPLPQPVVLRARIDDGEFVSELCTQHDPGVRIEVREEGHRFFPADGGGWMRENRLWRRVTDATDGSVIIDEEIAHNVGRVLYEPTAEQLAASQSAPDT